MKKIKKQIDLSYIGGLCLMLALILVLYCMVAAYGSKADDSSIKNVSDYDGYIGKTWVNAEDLDEVYSFTITALDQDSIEGGGRLFGSFEGTVSENRAEFDFEQWGDSGHAVLEMLSPEEIAVKVTYAERAEENQNNMETEDVFRPLRLSDIEPFIPNEEISFGTELDSMGYRYFAAGMFDNEVRPSAVLYMTDGDGNILNEFMVSWINQMEIVKLSVEDINEDGRSDIRVWTAMKDKAMVPFFQGIFLQNSDGTFPHNATVTDVILYGNDSINFRKEENAPKGLPDALEDEIRETLSDGSFSQFIEKYETAYRQLSDSEKQEYAVKDETGLLASCLEEVKTKDDAWFVPEGTDDILIRHEEKGGRYSYYAFQRGHGKDSYLMRAVGLNEEFYVVTWNESRYLLTTKRKNNVLTGIAVYCMYGEDSYGWLLYQEKTQDGGIVSRYYSYVDDEGGIGTYWPEYEFLYDYKAIRGQWQTDMEDDYYYYNLLGGAWEVKEYVDSAVESTGGEWEEDEYKEYVKRSEKYLGMRFVLNKEDITKRAPGGFVFDTYEDLFASVRQPYTLEISPPFVGAMVSSDQWEETMNANYLFIDSKGKAYLMLRGYFFVIERAGKEAK